MKTLLIITFLLYSLTISAKDFVYITSDTSIPFWQIMAKGANYEAINKDNKITILNSKNSPKQEMINTMMAIKSKPDGIVISPCNSSSAKTPLNFLEKHNIPVVIADIGSVSDNYISYISSDNEKGSYELGKFLVEEFKKQNNTSSVGIISIPQKRENGRLRTQGFLKELEGSETSSAGLRQQNDFSEIETYSFTKSLLINDDNIGAIWLRGSDKYKGAQKAIIESGRKVTLLTFDAEPEFIELISNGEILASAMQQPFYIGRKSIQVLNDHLNGKKVEKEIKVNTIVATKYNINGKLYFIKQNVLGILEK